MSGRGLTSNPRAAYEMGYTGVALGHITIIIQKVIPSADRGLKFGLVKLERLVKANQHVALNIHCGLSLSPVKWGKGFFL